MRYHTIQRLLLFFIATLFLSLSSCGNDEPSDQEMLERDQEEYDELMDGHRILFYKFIRIAIQSAAGKGENRDEFTQEDADRVEEVSNSISTVLETQEVTSISLYEYYQIYSLYSDATEYLEEVEEDEFPLVFAGLSEIIYPDRTNNYLQLEPSKEDEFRSLEHAYLASTAATAKGQATDIAVYEISKCDVTSINDPSIRVHIGTLKSIIYSVLGLYYLADREFEGQIDYASNQENLFIQIPAYKTNLSNKDLIYNIDEIIAYLTLFRGLNGLSMERDIDRVRAKENLLLALELFEKQGVNNELIQLASIYVAIENDDYEQAIKSLRLLEKSDMFPGIIKTEMANTIVYLEQRDKESALNFFHDKAFVVRIAVHLIKKAATDEKVKTAFAESGIELPKEMVNVQSTAISIYDQVENVRNETDVDKLKSHAEESGKSFWNKAKELMDE